MKTFQICSAQIKRPKLKTFMYLGYYISGHTQSIQNLWPTIIYFVQISLLVINILFHSRHQASIIVNMRWEMIVVNEWDVVLEQYKAECTSNYSPIDQWQYLDHRFNVTSDLRRFRSAMSISSCLGFVRTFYKHIKDQKSFRYIYHLLNLTLQ